MDYKNPVPQHGSVLAGIYVRSHEQAMLLQAMLREEMMRRAGRPEESVLAQWHNELEKIREKAFDHAWVGW